MTPVARMALVAYGDYYPDGPHGFYVRPDGSNFSNGPNVSNTVSRQCFCGVNLMIIPITLMALMALKDRKVLWLLWFLWLLC